MEKLADASYGDVPKWLKGPHSKCGRSGNRREGSNPSISVENRTRATETGFFRIIRKSLGLETKFLRGKQEVHDDQTGGIGY